MWQLGFAGEQHVVLRKIVQQLLTGAIASNCMLTHAKNASNSTAHLVLLWKKKVHQVWHMHRNKAGQQLCSTHQH